MATEKTLAAKITLDSSDADQSIKSIKTQLKEANAELIKVSERFGETSAEAVKAAKAVAGLKDRIGDTKALSEAFSPDKKFQALSSALSGVAGGFAALQGAQALFGSESKDLEKTLVKVQGALALSQGLSAITEAQDSFKNLKIVAVDAFKGIKAAIGSTGIGLLVIALGAIYAYWDDIKEVVSGVSVEQKKLNEESKKNLATQEEKLKAIDGQSQQLKLQGKSEKEILQLKVKQSEAAIQAAEINLVNAENTKKAQVDAATRNAEFTKGIIIMLTSPIQVILGVIDAVSFGLNKIGVISDATYKQFGNLRESFTSGLTSMIFDPVKVAKDGDATIKTAKEDLNKLKEQQAGFKNQINEIDKKDSDDKKVKNKADDDAAQKRLEEANKIIADAERSLLTERKQKEIDIENNFQEQKKKLIAAGITDFTAIEKQRDNAINILNKESANQRLAIVKETEKIIQDEKLKLMEEGFEKNKILLENQYNLEQEQALKILDDKSISEEDRQILYNARKLAIEQKYIQEKQALIDQNAIDEINAEIAKLDEIINSDTTKLQAKEDALNAEKAILDKMDKNSKDYTDKYKKYSEARAKIDTLEKEQKIKNAQAVAGMLSTISDLIGKQTVAGKIAAVAATTIQTYVAAQEAFTNAQKSPITAAFPAYPYIQAALAVATGIKNVKAILSTPVPGGGGGGSAPSATLSGTEGTAPLSPQASVTALPQDQINQLSTANAAVRNYVLESDVTSNQERITRINRAARIN